uniref:Uncharacterized protein n=1 Tax=Cannabis sativa TaxID=3483 RepID=A0A803NUC1_CANSA
MSQKVLQALKKRSSDNSGQTPSPKRPREEVPSKEKGLAETVIDLSEEMVPTMDPPTQKASSIVVVLSSKAKKGKEILKYYLDRSLPEVSDQLSGANNELSLELVMGGVLKEATRKEVDSAKKQVGEVRAELGEVKKKLFATTNRVEELTKEI